jgi:predicted unusual protein kinase regulating ubiquinone biosynthesis (AarF/ABC1/UbiB family)
MHIETMYGFRLFSVLHTDTSAAPVANKLASQRLTVDFSSETAAEGLVLCPSDIDASNFIIDNEGTVFAIDFGRTGYMPPSFVAYSLEHWKPFTRLVAREIKFPKSANLDPMSLAAGFLVRSGNNSLGK